MNHTRKNFGNTYAFQEGKSSFFAPDLVARDKMNDLYARLRDDLRGADLKEKIENLWNEYESIAPDGFLTKAQIDFHQHWWEMYLSVGLLHLSKISSIGVETSKRNIGPDIRVTLKNGSIIWIEAVAPNTGEGNDRVPEHKEDCVFDVPKDECLLRLTQGIASKKDKVHVLLINLVTY